MAGLRAELLPAWGAVQQVRQIVPRDFNGDEKADNHGGIGYGERQVASQVIVS